jgi:hypothetical protein
LVLRQAIQVYSHSSRIYHKHVVPLSIFPKPVHGIDPALRGFGLGIRAVRNLPLDLDN